MRIRQTFNKNNIASIKGLRDYEFQILWGLLGTFVQSDAISTDLPVKIEVALKNYRFGQTEKQLKLLTQAYYEGTFIFPFGKLVTKDGMAIETDPNDRLTDCTPEEKEWPKFKTPLWWYIVGPPYGLILLVIWYGCLYASGIAFYFYCMYYKFFRPKEYWKEYAMTPEQLAEIEARVKQATPGPWDYGTAICCPDRGWIDHPKGVVCKNEGAKMTHSLAAEDAEFIAHAWQDVQDMLSYIRHLEKEYRHVKQMNAELSEQVWSETDTEQAAYDASKKFTF